MQDAEALSLDAVRGLLAAGRVFAAYDRILRIRRAGGDSPPLAALEARALESLGRAEEASSLLASLGVATTGDPEALGLLAAITKRRALAASTPAARQAGLAEARGLYARGWARFGGSWFGINVATLTFVLGDRDGARQEAGRVLALLDLEAPRAEEDSEAGAWHAATEGEAHLLADAPWEAAGPYRRLHERVAARGAWAVLASARRNVELIRQSAGAGDPRAKAAADVLDLLVTPPVIVATGHLVDDEGRSPPRFPEGLVSGAREAVSAVLDETGASVGFSSLAAGFDLVFQDELERRHVPRHVLLPFEEARFLEDSVADRGRYGWVADFHRLLTGAERRYQASRNHPDEEGAAFAYANEMLLGLARLEADRLDTTLLGLALWDGRGGQEGGSASALSQWQASGALDAVRILRPQELAGWPRSGPRPEPPVLLRPPPYQPAPVRVEPGRSAIVAMLFGDVRGFGALDETQMETFVRRYLGAIGEVVAKHRADAAEVNTWAGQLFLVFPDLEAAGRCALDLAERLVRARPDLPSWGLPPDLGLRMALHAGPIRFVRNAITDRLGAFGSQVSVGARIEPIAPPEQAFASEAFAALCRARRVRSFACRYVGRRELAKAYGEASVYRLER